MEGRLDPGDRNELLDRIVEAIADPVFVKDEQHRWIIVNEAFCRFMGHPREALLGRSDYEFFSKEQADTFWAKDEEVFADGGVNINEEPLTDADGETHIIVTKKTVFRTEGGAKALVGIIRDVTDLKEAEAALRASRDELEQRVEDRTKQVEATQARLWQAQKMEAIGQLTGGVAHDFNNLLVGILGSADMLQHGIGTPEEQANYVQTIVETGQRAAELVRQLLAFSRPAPAHKTPLDAHDVTGEVIAILQRTIDPRILVRSHFKAGHPTVAADRTALHSALLNLGLNARDAMPEGGVLTFTTKDVVLDAETCRHQRYPVEPGAYLEIGVADNGTGMSKEVLERIFEPFYTTKSVGAGTGLGLAAVYGTVRGHGGVLDVYSEPGNGTHFRMLLPSSEDPVATGSAHAAEIVRGTGHVLLVDDEPVIRNLGRDMLRSLGYEVSLADGGEEALAIFRERGDGIDLIVLDLIMPGLNGSQVLAELKRIDNDVRVLIASGFRRDVDLPQADGDGAAGFIGKPFVLSSLSQAVASALQPRG